MSELRLAGRERSRNYWRMARSVYARARDARAYVANLTGLQLRRFRAQREPLPARWNFSGTTRLGPYIASSRAPWLRLEIPPCATPGMISPEECQYYSYLGQFYLGRGAIVELGPWLGRSTFYIVQGLRANPNFDGKRMEVFDDFIWRAAWMNPNVPASDYQPNHMDSQFLFEKYSGGLAPYINTSKRRITSFDGNENVAPLVWREGMVELMFIDCGRTIQANEAWYEIFAPFWIPDVTLLILQDWGTHREIPVKAYNQIKRFVDSKGRALQMVHELKSGQAAMFIYRGK